MAVVIKLDKKDLGTIRKRAYQIADQADKFVNSRMSPLRQAAEQYAIEVRNNILTERFAAEYAPLQLRYKMWKNSIMRAASLINASKKSAKTISVLPQGDFNKFWQLSGSVVSNIKVWKSPMPRGGAYFSGLERNDSVSHFSRKKGSSLRKTKGTWYAVIIERGGGNNVPARPMFEPTWTRFMKARTINQVIMSFRMFRMTWRP